MELPTKQETSLVGCGVLDAKLIVYIANGIDLCFSFFPTLPPTYHLPRIDFVILVVMGCGAGEATDLGFACFVVINPCVLSTNRVDFELFFCCCFINFPIVTPRTEALSRRERFLKAVIAQWDHPSPMGVKMRKMRRKRKKWFPRWFFRPRCL